MGAVMSQQNPGRTKILLRSLGLQLFLNYKTMQGPGYLLALRGEGRKLDEQATRTAASFINGHPAFSGIALGALSKRLREPVDDQKAKELMEWKRGLSTPLGAIGDSLIWERYKPGSLAVLVLLMLIPTNNWMTNWVWGAASVLAIYNLSLWWFRNWGFSHGFALGERVSELALHPALPAVQKFMRGFGIAAAGAVIGATLSRITGDSGVSLLQYIAGFIVMVGAVYMRFSTLTVAFVTVLCSFAIYYFTISTPLLP